MVQCSKFKVRGVWRGGVWRAKSIYNLQKPGWSLTKSKSAEASLFFGELLGAPLTLKLNCLHNCFDWLIVIDIIAQ